MGVANYSRVLLCFSFRLESCKNMFTDLIVFNRNILIVPVGLLLGLYLVLQQTKLNIKKESNLYNRITNSKCYLLLSMYGSITVVVRLL